MSAAKQARSANVVFAVEGRELAPFISTEIRLALEARAEVQRQRSKSCCPHRACPMCGSTVLRLAFGASPSVANVMQAQ